MGDPLKPSEFVYPDAILSTAGHVDHGKTTVVLALTGIWAARHSEEIKRAMTIKLGYADVNIYECPSEEGYGRYVSDGLLNGGKCPNGDEPQLVRKISILDVPGHEVLIATMISGAALVDAALMVVDASMPVPQPQTEEHFAALTIMGVRNMVVAQNKIDVVPREKAIENYRQIRGFLGNTWASESPIIPVSALHKVNIDALISHINGRVPRRTVDVSAPPRMLIVRSFNVNRPGTPPSELKGGIIGGTLVQGVLRVGDEIEIRPGVRYQKGDKTVYQPLISRIVSIAYGNVQVEEARPGGLVGIMTELDPALAKADALAGSVCGRPGALPPVWTSLEFEFKPLERLVQREKMEPVKPKEALMINVGSATTWGLVTRAKKDVISVSLRRAVSAERGARIVVSRQVRQRWRVIGYGTIVGGDVALE